MSSPTGGPVDLPHDARVLFEILKSMGVEHWEPRVVPQLLEFMHRYTSDVFSDALVYNEHAGGEELEVASVRLAIQSRINFSFVQPPPREFLNELAQARNKVRLPLMPTSPGVFLPKTEYWLSGPDYQIEKRPAQSFASAEMNHSQ